VEIGPPATKIYTWKTHDGAAGPSGFGGTAHGQALVHEKVWNRIELGKERTVTPMKEKATGVVSPEGRLLATTTSTGLEIRDLQTHRSAASFKLPGEVRAVSWSPDSQRLAVVWSKGFAYDVLSVFTSAPSETPK
jgi:WD40 repeat protein